MFLQNTNRKPYAIYRIVPLSMTLSDLWLGFQGHDIFCRQISEKTARLKVKVTIAQEESIPTMVWYYVWWPWLTSKCITRVCHHQLSFLFYLPDTVPVTQPTECQSTEWIGECLCNWVQSSLVVSCHAKTLQGSYRSGFPWLSRTFCGVFFHDFPGPCTVCSSTSFYNTVHATFTAHCYRTLYKLLCHFASNVRVHKFN